MQKNKISAIGIICNPKIPEKNLEIINEILKYLKDKNFEILIEKNSAKYLNFKEKIGEIKEIKEIYADVVFTFGGDGTILYSLKELPNIPLILGINFGNFGFLTELNNKNAIEGIKKLINNEYYIEERTMLCVNKKYSALNELLVCGEFPTNLINFSLILNNKDKFKFRADGIIIATQTGSTAYSLSVGGPIVYPNANVFVITPVNPFLRRSKSIVVNDETEISLIVEKGKADIYLIIDGKQVEKLEFKHGLKEKISIEKSKDKAKFIRFKEGWKIKKII